MHRAWLIEHMPKTTLTLSDEIAKTLKVYTVLNQTACGHPALKDGVCFGPHAWLAGIQKSWSLCRQNPLGPHS